MARLSTPSEEEELKPFSRIRCELSVEGDYVLWGPPIASQAHPGINHMKGLAQGYVLIMEAR
jgi:hypothetical protein